jgi:hypothetical protein
MAGELEGAALRAARAPGHRGSPRGRSSLRGELTEQAHEQSARLASSAAVGSSRSHAFGTERQRPGDGHSQLLAAGERAGVLGENSGGSRRGRSSSPRSFGEVLRRKPWPGADVVQDRPGNIAGAWGTSATRRRISRGGGASARRRRRTAPALVRLGEEAEDPQQRSSSRHPNGHLRVSTVPPPRCGGRLRSSSTRPRTSSGGHGFEQGGHAAEHRTRPAGGRTPGASAHRPPGSRP